MLEIKIEKRREHPVALRTECQWVWGTSTKNYQRPVRTHQETTNLQNKTFINWLRVSHRYWTVSKLTI